VHENMIYGLTKGQAAPTSRPGLITPVQVEGVFEKPLNPVALAISLDVPFVARVLSGDIARMKEIMKKAIAHKGFSIVDIFQPCVSFNKTNTYQWFKDNTFELPSEYDPSDRAKAFAMAIKEEPFPLGIIYENAARKPFEDNLRIYRNSKTPLYKRERMTSEIESELSAYD